MKTPPKELDLAVYLLILVAAGSAILALKDGEALRYSDVLIIGSALFQVILFRFLSPALYLTAPPFLAALGLIHHFQYEALKSPWNLLSQGILVAAGIAFTPLILPRPRRVIRNPSLRWWRTVPRKTLFLAAQVRPVLGGELLSQTINLSETGAFISLQGAQWLNCREKPQRNFRIGTYCSVRLSLDQIYAFTCSAEVVRHSAATATCPEGIALRFVGMSSSERRRLSAFLQVAEEEVMPAVCDLKGLAA